MRKNDKTFDSVKMMREIRDRLSQQFRSMSFEEQKQHMNQRIQVVPVKTSRDARSTHNA